MRSIRSIDHRTGRRRESASLADHFGPAPWLVVGPHDDDVMLGMGATMHWAKHAGLELHAAIVTDGRMGYGRPEERESIVATRVKETRAALAVLGVPTNRLHWLGFPDGNLACERGVRPDREGSGIARKLVALMREVRPAAVFVCSPADVHPDHHITAEEMPMACRWAAAPNWLELGEPIAEPTLWHYAVYCDFPESPDTQVCVAEADLDAKLASLGCYESQPFIRGMVARIREDGPVEYLRRAVYAPYRPARYHQLFEGRDVLVTGAQHTTESPDPGRDDGTPGGGGLVPEQA